MAAPVLLVLRNRRRNRRHRIFRDRTHPLEIYDDEKVHKRFRFPRYFIYQLAAELEDDIRHELPRKGCLTPVLQVCVALRFYASGSQQTVLGDLFGVDQATVSRTVTRVTNAIFRSTRRHITFPDQAEADRHKVKFYRMAGFPDVFGCVDGTHVRIQAPADGHEADYVNRKNFHSLNVQVICDANLVFINVVARWPGSVHDARILRTSPLFRDFEDNPRPPVRGVILADSAYMLRWWLMTPLLRPSTAAERRYNYAHSSTRATVERSIGVAKQRWRCLRVGLMMDPQKASRVIMVCCVLHNRARRENLPLPPADSDTDDSDDEDDNAAGRPLYANHQNVNERARTEAGKAVRGRIITNNFAGPHMNQLPQLSSGSDDNQ